jgi:hypothetical protein
MVRSVRQWQLNRFYFILFFLTNSVFFLQKLEGVENDPIAKLGDFGLGAILEGKAPDTYVGTRVYQAPVNASDHSAASGTD